MQSDMLWDKLGAFILFVRSKLRCSIRILTDPDKIKSPIKSANNYRPKSSKSIWIRFGSFLQKSEIFRPYKLHHNFKLKLDKKDPFKKLSSNVGLVLLKKANKMHLDDFVDVWKCSLPETDNVKLGFLCISRLRSKIQK